MSRHEEVLPRLTTNVACLFGLSWRQWLVVLIVTNLALFMLACTFFGRTTRSPSGLIVHLPTLTRTRLPTLTPTANPTAVALAATAAVTPSASPPSPTSGTSPPDTPPAPVAVSPTNADAVPPEVTTVAPPELSLTNSPTATASPPPTPTATPTAAPTPTDTPPPAPTVTPLPDGWVFADLRLSPAPNGSDLLVLGNLINNTGSTQTLDTIDGLFYDNQGQMMDNIFYTFDYPINEMPQGGQMPFQIEVEDRPNAADVKLQVLAESGGAAPRQDFEFLEINAGPQGNEYCVAGKVRNPGSELSRYLVIAAVLYNSENKVINYNYDDYDEALGVLAGEQTQDIAMCVDPLQQEVARYELEAWGL